jgi:hypothetical protein
MMAVSYRQTHTRRVAAALMRSNVTRSLLVYAGTPHSDALSARERGSDLLCHPHHSWLSNTPPSFERQPSKRHYFATSHPPRGLTFGLENDDLKDHIDFGGLIGVIRVMAVVPRRVNTRKF